jgi:Ca2+/H+ antiporter, TMEM165/GDT1 family
MNVLRDVAAPRKPVEPLATTNGLVGTWAGSTGGMVAADGLAIVFGQQLGARLPQPVVRIGAAVTFVLFGLVLIIEGVR